MNAIKLIVYLVLLAGTLASGKAFFSEYNRLAEESAARADQMAEVFDDGSERPNQSNTGLSDSTEPSPESPSQSTNPLADESDANTESAAVEETPQDTTAPAPETSEEPPQVSNEIDQAPPSAQKNRIGLYLGCFVLSAVGLGLLLAFDLARGSANKSVDLIYNDNGVGTDSDALYEQAEAAWARSEFLEAIGLLRDYLEINPIQQHAAIRIAEIYEKDLSNYLAASMEYEEILKQKLAPERWAWMAVHLANLYSGRLDQPEKAISLLRDLVDRYPETAAAAKAAKRLEMIDGS